jgi:hypothetical protein
MSDEITRMVAHAIVALAESAQGLGGALREQIANSAETNRILASIHDQNTRMEEEMKMLNGRHSSSERLVRVLQVDVKDIREELARHGERIEELEGPAEAAREQLG